MAAIDETVPSHPLLRCGVGCGIVPGLSRSLAGPRLTVRSVTRISAAMARLRQTARAVSCPVY